MKSALILVDIQNDFSPQGALPVPGGDDIIPVVNQLIPWFDVVVATKDWHPSGHSSFASTHQATVGDVKVVNGVDQIMWPDHCIQNSPGSEFISGLATESIDHVIYKGTHTDIDSYSGFFDNQDKFKTELDQTLQQRSVDTLFILGLATDYCVKFTALDALRLGYHTIVVKEGCRGVELNRGDIDKAYQEIEAKGGKVMTLSQVMPLLGENDIENDEK